MSQWQKTFWGALRNEVLKVFYDDWSRLTELMGCIFENLLQSTTVKYSKDKFRTFYVTKKWIVLSEFESSRKVVKLVLEFILCCINGKILLMNGVFKLKTNSYPGIFINKINLNTSSLVIQTHVMFYLLSNLWIFLSKSINKTIWKNGIRCAK